MKVLFFIGALTGGGAERVTAGLANYLVRNGHQATLATMHHTDRDFYILDSKVGRVCLNLAGRNRGLAKLTANYRRLRALRRVIHAEQPEVAVGMMPTATILCILASLGLPTRVVGSERNYPGRKPIGRPWAFLRRLLYRFADAHVAQTREAADWIIRHSSAHNVTVIPNSVAWPIKPCPPYVDPTVFVPPARRLILAVGSKSWQKGLDLLLDAYERMANDHPGWDLAIIGLTSVQHKQSRSWDLLHAQAEAAGLAERVHFPGLVGNVGDWYERSELFVLSSRYEGFPNALLEAMAAGCACIAFDCDAGPRDVINHGENGLLVDAEDVSLLAQAMSRLAGDTATREALRFAARGVLEQYSESLILAEWTGLLERIVNDRRNSIGRSE